LHSARCQYKPLLRKNNQTRDEMEEKTKTKVLKMRGAPGKVRSDERMSDGRWQGAELEVAYM
jgi:hypothetical protein